MPVQAQPAAGVLGPLLILAEDLAALVVERSAVGQLVDPPSGLEARVQLDAGLGPQQPLVKLAPHVLANALVADREEALRVLAIVAAQRLPEGEDVQISQMLDRI